MALSISELNAVSHEYFDKTLMQEVYEESAFVSWLKAKNKIVTNGGTQIQFPIRYKALGQTATTHPRQQISFESEETRTAGVVDWAFILGKTMIHWDEKVKNGPKGQIIDLVKDKSLELKEDFMHEFASQLWATTSKGTDDLERIATIVDSSTSYAGIAVSDDPLWASTEDGSTTVMTLRLLQKARNAATFGKRLPTVHFTTRDLLSKFESILQPHVRYESEDTKRMLNLGFSNVSFYGAPVVADTYIPSGNWYGLDMEAFELHVNPEYNFKLSDWMELPQAGFPNAAGRFMYFTGQILCKLRRTSFKFTALDADK
jgi:hypothetical protein